MAVRKKTTNRKTGAAKKRKARTGPAVVTVKIAGSGTFSKQSCHSTKTAAAKQADRIRAQGNKARVIKSGSAHCVYKGGKMKANSPFMKARKSRRA